MATQRGERIDVSELERLHLFKDIEPGKVIELLGDCQVICLEKDTHFISQGELNRNCYFILSGSLRVHLDSLDNDAVSILQVGESVGEVSMLDGQHASAHVVCHEESELLVMEEDIFWSLVNTSHNFSRNLLLSTVRRLRSSNVAISENQKKQRQYKLIATIDELTGLYNRRWLKNMLERQMTRSLYSNTPLSLLVIDIDHFKSVNDTYGHNVGDLVLQGVARIMMNSVRPTDLVTRYGGEEFVIVLPGSELAGARIVAERVCSIIAETPMFAPGAGELPRVTVSLGAAQMQEDESMDEFIGRADAALYRAKRNGRNRVEE